MANIVGRYQHERSENLDEYFKGLGVPYMARKMMGLSNPVLEIKNDGDKWTIRNETLMRTTELTFTLNEEYEEPMPSGDVLKNVTTMDGNSLVTVSENADNNKITRKYEFTEAGFTLTMTNDKTGQTAKRYYKRI